MTFRLFHRDFDPTRLSPHHVVAHLSPHLLSLSPLPPPQISNHSYSLPGVRAPEALHLLTFTGEPLVVARCRNSSSSNSIQSRIRPPAGKEKTFRRTAGLFFLQTHVHQRIHQWPREQNQQQKKHRLLLPRTLRLQSLVAKCQASAEEGAAPAHPSPVPAPRAPSLYLTPSNACFVHLPTSTFHPPPKTLAFGPFLGQHPPSAILLHAHCRVTYPPLSLDGSLHHLPDLFAERLPLRRR